MKQKQQKLNSEHVNSAWVLEISQQHYVFEDENGVRITVEGGEWDWGNYYHYTYSDIDVIDFAAYISTLDIEDIDREFGYIIQTYEKTLKGDK